MNRCKGKTLYGTRCKIPAGYGQYCGWHNPRIYRNHPRVDHVRFPVLRAKLKLGRSD